MKVRPGNMEHVKWVHREWIATGAKRERDVLLEESSIDGVSC